MREAKQQDLVWVRLPFSDLSGKKFRPAVVASNNYYNDKMRDVIVCAITSKMEQMEYSILVDDSKLSSGKIPLKSRIRADKILQIEKELIVKSFARLDDRTFDSLTSEILKLVKRAK